MESFSLPDYTPAHSCSFVPLLFWVVHPLSSLFLYPLLSNLPSLSRPSLFARKEKPILFRLYSSWPICFIHSLLPTTIQNSVIQSHPMWKSTQNRHSLKWYLSLNTTKCCKYWIGWTITSAVGFLRPRSLLARLPNKQLLNVPRPATFSIPTLGCQQCDYVGIKEPSMKIETPIDFIRYAIQLTDVIKEFSHGINPRVSLFLICDEIILYFYACTL